MKKKQTVIGIIVGLLFLAVFASTIQAATSYELVVNNRTSKTLEFAVVGPENHLVTVGPLEKVYLDLFPGIYQYSFYDCGQLYIDTINMNKDKVIKLYPCSGSDSGATGTTGSSDGGGAPAELIDIVLNNKTYKTLTVALVGVQNYSFDLPPGKTFATIYKGTYDFSYYDCGKLNIVSVKFTKNDSQIKILNCGQSQGTIGSSGPGVSVNDEDPGIQFFVKNDTYTSFDFLLLSDLVYTFHVVPGKNKVNVLPGSYQYSYYACGELWIGTIQIFKKDQDIRISSCSSKSGRPDTGQNVMFKVKNLTGSKFVITLDGPQFYTLDVRGGISTLLLVEKGYYSYKYYACGSLVTGEIFVKDGVTLKTVNCPGD